MSNRLNVKQSKKDRPRSSDKLRKNKRDTSPDKPGTPSGDALQEEQGPQEKQVIVNDEILAMAVKEEDLKKLHEPRPPSGEKQHNPAIVRKMRPRSEWDKPKPKKVTVQREAPPDAPLKPIDFAEGSGARFDKQGNIIPYSILGTIEDYKTQAMKMGQLPEELSVIRDVERTAARLPVRYDLRPSSSASRASPHPMMQSVDESSALKNWQKRMRERRKQQDYLANMLQKAPEQLVMNQSDNYRETQEQRYMIDRTIAAVDYGKGYRIGSEFWKQQEEIGDEMKGMHMALTQTERGYPPPIEQVGVPDVVLQEKGIKFNGGHKSGAGVKKSWDNTEYLRQRTQQLQPIMDELLPHRAQTDQVAIVGSRKYLARYDATHARSPHTPGSAGSITRAGAGGGSIIRVGSGGSNVQAVSQTDGAGSPGPAHSVELPVSPAHSQDDEDFDPLSGHPNIHPAPVFGPSLLLAGQAARWTGDSTLYKGQLGLEARVTFEAYAEHRTTSLLDLTNDGTTTIYYDWKQLPKANPFDVMKSKVQRFYFNTTNGVLLPGDTMKFPFVFKSPNPGVFTERWELETHPVLCGGATLIVTLRGVALQEDKYRTQRNQLEMELARRQAEQVVESILDELLGGLQAPDRPRSPVDAYITDEEVFSRANPSLYYQVEVVNKLHTLFGALFADEQEEPPPVGEDEEPPTPAEPPVWDLSVDTLSKMIMAMDETDERKQEFLNKVNTHVITMSFPPFNPIQRDMYTVGYESLCDTVDKIVDTIRHTRTVLGMPERDTDDIPEDTTTPAGGAGGAPGGGGGGAGGVGSRAASRPDMKTPASRDSKRGPAAKGAGKGDGKDKKGAKDTKNQAAKATAKEPPKTGGKITPATAGGTGKRPTSTQGRSGSAGSGAPAQTSPAPPTVDPLLLAKYNEKIYTQSYALMCDMVDEMLLMFEDIETRNGGPKLPVLG